MSMPFHVNRRTTWRDTEFLDNEEDWFVHGSGQTLMFRRPYSAPTRDVLPFAFVQQNHPLVISLGKWTIVEFEDEDEPETVPPVRLL